MRRILRFALLGLSLLLSLASHAKTICVPAPVVDFICYDVPDALFDANAGVGSCGGSGSSDASDALFSPATTTSLTLPTLAQFHQATYAEFHAATNAEFHPATYAEFHPATNAEFHAATFAEFHAVDLAGLFTPASYTPSSSISYSHSQIGNSNSRTGTGITSDSSIYGASSSRQFSLPSGVPLSLAPVYAARANGAGDRGSAWSSWSVGNPVNSATGNKYETQLDYASAGPYPLVFMRTYNSMNQISDAVTTHYGVGWRGFYDRAVVVLTDQTTPTVRVVRADGKSFLFTQNNGVWKPSADVTAKLQNVTDGVGNITGWTYTTSGDEVETYDATGRLVSIVNRVGLTQALSYDGNGNLATVADPFGRTLSFNYDTQNRLLHMTDPAGGVYVYAYDGNNNLSSVTYPDGTSRTYRYENSAFPHAMTGLIDENGVRFATWTYDSQGRAVSSVLAGGVQRVTLTYNSDGTTRVRDALGTTRVHNFQNISGTFKNGGVTVTCPGCAPLTSTATYDANGFITSRTDFNGNTTTYQYDSRGLEISRTEAAGTPVARTTTTLWHPTFRLPVQITLPDRVANFSYDAQGNLTQRTVTAGGESRTWRYAYNSLGLVTEVRGPRTDVADVTRFDYDAQGNLVSITNALNQVTRITAYDSHGLPLSMTDPNGVAGQLAYDARGRLIRMTVDGRTVSYHYDNTGKLTQIVFADGSTQSYAYDAAYRLTQVTDALGNRMRYTFDAASNPIKTELLDANGNLVASTSRVYDALGRVIRSVDANNQATQFSYDNNNNLLSVTDPLLRTTTYDYDELDRRVASTDASGGVTQMGYDVAGRVAEVDTPNGATTRYVYSGLGDLLQEISSDRGTINLTYDSAGNMLTRTDARGITARYTYDALNRLLAIHYPKGQDADDEDDHEHSGWFDEMRHRLTEALGEPEHQHAWGDDVTFTYDAGRDCHFGVGRLCAVEDQSGVTRYNYDTFGNPTRQTETRHKRAYTTSYTYDALNRLTRMTYPDGRVVDYTLDALGRIQGADATVNNIRASILRDVSYRADGLPLTLSFGNGISDTRGYDSMGRLLYQSVGAADTRAYGYDAVGNLVQKQTTPETDSYFYDALDRLVQESRTTATTDTTGFAYDANGNRVSQTQASGTIPYIYLAASNRLLQAGGDTVMLDDAGNTVSDHHGARTFTYGPAGRLTEVRNKHHRVAVYRYNAWGLRTEKRTEKGVTLYHYDQWGRLLSETRENSHPRRDYVWGGAVPLAQIDVRPGQIEQEAKERSRHDDHDDELIGRERVTYLHTDHSGTPRLATDNKQAVIWRWESDAFGAGLPSGSVTINLRFPGQYFDAETKLHYNWMRYYNPETGRYLTSDPIGLGGGVNSYAYTSNNPLRWVDPLGLSGSDPLPEAPKIPACGKILTESDFPNPNSPTCSAECLKKQIEACKGCGLSAGICGALVNQAWTERCQINCGTGGNQNQACR